MPIDPATLQHFAQRYTEAWNGGDPKCVAAFYAPDGSLQINDAPPAVGWQGIAAAAKQFMTAFPDLRVELDRLVINADHAIYHWTLTGTNSGPGGTGRKSASPAKKSGTSPPKAKSPTPKAPSTSPTTTANSIPEFC